MNRREALKHTALLLGVSLSPSALNRALAQLDRAPSAGPVHLTAPRFAAAAALAERGLDQLNAAGPNGYAALPPERQDELILALAAAPEQDRRFLRAMRQAVFLGYFSSERVCKEVFKHDPIPGRYKADVSLQEATGGVAWSE